MKDKLEIDTGELINILNRQVKERQRMRLRTNMKHCSTWLNGPCYNDPPLDMSKPKQRPAKIEEIVKVCSPERKAEIKAAFSKAMGNTRISKPRTESEIMQCKNKIIKELLKG